MAAMLWPDARDARMAFNFVVRLCAVSVGWGRGRGIFMGLALGEGTWLLLALRKSSLLAGLVFSSSLLCCGESAR